MLQETFQIRPIELQNVQECDAKKLIVVIQPGAK